MTIELAGYPKYLNKYFPLQLLPICPNRLVRDNLENTNHVQDNPPNVQKETKQEKATLYLDYIKFFAYNFLHEPNPLYNGIYQCPNFKVKDTVLSNIIRL